MSYVINAPNPSPTISISPSSPVFNITNSTCANLTVNASGNVAGGTYSIPMIFLTPTQQKNLTLIVSVLSFSNWTASQNFTALTVQVPSVGLLGVQTFNNTGSVPLSVTTQYITMNKSFDSALVLDTSPFTLAVNASKNISVYYLLNTSWKPDNYSVTIQWFENSANTTKNWTINATVPDVLVPTVNVSLRASEIFYNETQSIDVRASDDIGVKNITIYLANATSKIALSPSDNLTAFGIVISNQTQLGNKTIIVGTCDFSGNCATANVTYAVLPFSFINASESVRFGKWKIGTTAKRTLLESSGLVDINITLTNLVLVNTTISTFNPKFKVIWNDRFGERETDFNGTVSLVGHVGTLRMVALSDTYGKFDGYVNIGLPSWVGNPQPRIHIDGEFTTFTASAEFQLDLPSALGKMQCVPSLQDSYNSSNMQCIVTYPVDVTEDELSVVVSKTSVDTERASFKGEIARQSAEISDLNLRITVILALLIGTGAVGSGLWWWKKLVSEKVTMKN